MSSSAVRGLKMKLQRGISDEGLKRLARKLAGGGALDPEISAIADNMLGDFWRWRNAWLAENTTPENEDGVLMLFNQYMKS